MKGGKRQSLTPGGGQAGSRTGVKLFLSGSGTRVDSVPSGSVRSAVDATEIPPSTPPAGQEMRKVQPGELYLSAK